MKGTRQDTSPAGKPVPHAHRVLSRHLPGWRPMGEPDGARGNRRGQRGARTPSTCFPKGTGELTVTRQLSQCNPAGECGQHEREQSAGGSWREQVEGERRGTVKPERREAFCRSKAGETSWWSTSQVQQLAQLAGASPSGGDGRWFIHRCVKAQAFTRGQRKCL